MRKSVDMRLPPPKLGEIEAETEALGCARRLDTRLGVTLRTLACSKPGGVFLQAGTGSPELSAWLLDGMDITSRLITVVTDHGLSAVTSKFIGDDIRVAVHSQELLEFLTDIRSHQIEMIVLDGVTEQQATVRAALELLAPGGMLVALGQTDLRNLLSEDESYQTTALEPDLTLVARRVLAAKHRRRGARRSRRLRSEESASSS